MMTGLLLPALLVLTVFAGVSHGQSLHVSQPRINLTLVAESGGNVTAFPPGPFRGIQGIPASVLFVVARTSLHGNVTYTVDVDNANVVIPTVENVMTLSAAMDQQETAVQITANMTSSSGPSYVITNVDKKNVDKYVVVNVSVTVRRLGRAYIRLYESNAAGKTNGGEDDADEEDDGKREMLAYEAVVIRVAGVVELVFYNGLIILLVIVNICFGCDLDLSVVWGFIKKPIPPGIGFLSQFLLMPLIGLAVTQALQMDPIYGFGLIALASAPGGGGSNAWSVLLEADLNLSLTMTFASTILSLGMMPLWLLIVSRIYFDPADIIVPYLQIFLTLLQFVIPCVIGIIIRKVKEKWAKKIALATKPVCLLFLAWVLSIGTYCNWYMWELMGEAPKIIAAGVLLPWVGFAGGFTLATIFRQGRKRAVTIAIETGIQNVGIPILMLQRKFPQPDGDMAASVANSVAIFTPLPLYVALIVMVIRKRCCKDDKQLVPTEDVDEMEKKPIDDEDKDNNKNDLKQDESKVV